MFQLRRNKRRWCIIPHVASKHSKLSDEAKGCTCRCVLVFGVGGVSPISHDKDDVQNHAHPNAVHEQLRRMLAILPFHAEACHSYQIKHLTAND
jgi:hypothetical protein